MGLFNFFGKGKKTDFFDLLVQHTNLVYESYKVLTKYIKTDVGNPSLAEQIYQLERQADDVRRILIDRLNQTLVTPIDREDLFALSLGIDDVIDSAKNTVEEIHIFKVKPDRVLVSMSEILEKGTLELDDALKNLSDHPEVSKSHAVKAKDTENHIHHIYVQALADLFDDASNSPGYMFKMREIYRHLNRSSDRCDEAANSILNIIVKME